MCVCVCVRARVRACDQIEYAVEEFPLLILRFSLFLLHTLLCCPDFGQMDGTIEGWGEAGFD